MGPLISRVDPRSSVLLSATTGEDTAIINWLKRKNDPNISDACGWTLLHHAASRLPSETVHDLINTLLTAGADPNAEAVVGGTPLHCAVASGNQCAVSALLLHSCPCGAPFPTVRPQKIAYVDALRSDGMTPLSIAAALPTASSAMMPLLLSAGADATVGGSSGRTSLAFAVAADHFEAIRLLRRKGAPLQPVDALQSSALHYVCSLDAIEALGPEDSLKSLYTSVNTLHQTPLHALLRRHRVRRGTAVDFTAPLALHGPPGAGAYNVAPIVSHMLARGCSIDAACQPHQRNSLHIAAARGLEDVLELLLRAEGAEEAVSRRDSTGATPWDLAGTAVRDAVGPRLQPRAAPPAPASLTPTTASESVGPRPQSPPLSTTAVNPLTVSPVVSPPSTPAVNPLKADRSLPVPIAEVGTVFVADPGSGEEEEDAPRRRRARGRGRAAAIGSSHV